MNLSLRGRGLRWAAVVVAASLAVVACGGPQEGSEASEQPDEPYRALLLAPLSGPLAATGAAVKAGFLGAVDVINANGGINGRQVEATVEDNKGDPAEVANLVNAAVASENPPDFIQPGLTSSETVAALPITSAAGILSGASSASANFEKSTQFPLYFGASPLNADAAAATVDKLAAAGFQSMALVVTDNESGVANIKPYEDAVAAKGIRLTGIERVAPDAIDATPQLQRLRDTSPDVVVLSMFGPALKPVMEARRTLGWQVPAWADHNATATPLEPLLGNLLTELTLVPVSYAVQGSETISSSAMQTAIAAIKAHAGGSLNVPFSVYIHSYFPLILVKSAADLAKTTDPQRIHDARVDLTPQNAPLYIGSSEMYADPESNFLSFGSQDFVVVSGAPLVDGLIAANPS